MRVCGASCASSGDRTARALRHHHDRPPRGVPSRLLGEADGAAWRGFVYVAFVIDVFTRRIIRWRARTTMQTEPVLDALEQALHDRELDGQMIVHSDRGSQYVAMSYTDSLVDAGQPDPWTASAMPMTMRSPSR